MKGSSIFALKVSIETVGRVGFIGLTEPGPFFREVNCWASEGTGRILFAMGPATKLLITATKAQGTKK